MGTQKEYIEFTKPERKIIGAATFVSSKDYVKEKEDEIMEQIILRGKKYHRIRRIV